MINGKKAFYIPAVAYLLVLSACGARTQTAEPVVMADCWHTFKLSAWQDIDGDGLWDASEPPLEGVRFRLVAGPMAEVWGYPPISNAEGLLEMKIWHPGGCFSEKYTIAVEPLESYQLTTPASVTFSMKPDEAQRALQFGFHPDLG